MVGIVEGFSPADWEFINGTDSTSEFPEINFYSPNTYSLNLEVTNDCGSTTDSEEFTIFPVPSLTNTDVEQTICSGTATNRLVFQSSEPNTTYTWNGTTSGNVDGVILTGTSNNIPSHILTLTDNNPVTVTYTVTPFLNDCAGSPFQFTIFINEGPSIATQPVGADYCIDGPSNALEFVLGGNPTGTIQYQWYYNATGSDDPNDPNTTAISAPEGQQATYTPPTDAVGTLYYFCVISFSGSGSCNEIKTIPVAITVHPNVIISDETPLDQTICAGANTDELSITTNNGGAGTLIYNWYFSTDTIIDNTDTLVGSNSNSYNPGVINTPGVYYYYVTIDVDESLGCSDVSSQLFTILVVDDPVVTIVPTNQTICTNTSAEILIAAASGGIDISGDGNIDNADYEFQWYLNGSPVTETNNTDGDDSTFNHDTTLPAGTYSYYCVISQPNDLDCNGTAIQ